MAAVILSADSEVGEDLLGRALIVKDSYALTSLEQHDALLLLVPYEDNLRREARLITNHHVVVRSDLGGSTIELPSIDRGAFRARLEARGVPAARADELARFAHFSVEAFQRAATAPAAQPAPAWVADLSERVPRRAWLVGKWSERRTGDLDALGQLLGAPYEEVRDDLLTLTAGTLPMFVVVGETWRVVSLDDAWRYGQPQLQPQDLSAFELLIQNVLGSVDPRLDLPVEERWLASVRGKVPIYSSDLRDGVAGVLALLGARGDDVGIGSGTVGSWLRQTMWQLFNRANEDASGQLWASLTDVLPLIAEAVPDVFLEAVQRGLEGDKPLLGSMFADSAGDALTVSSPHTGLLWALESVAWSPAHFSLAVEQLARLAEVDPGGRLSNRPAASLAHIYRSWLPQASVSLDRRMTTLDGLRTRHPTVAWPLMITMLPGETVGHYNHSPRFRDWKPTELDTADSGQIDPETYHSFDAAGLRLLDDAGVDPDRWIELAGHLDDLSPRLFEDATRRLLGLPSDERGAEIRSVVWEPLHALLQRHQRFSHATWAMRPERIEQLDTLVSTLAPPDVGSRVRWLFDEHMPDLPEEGGRDFDGGEYSEAVEHRRRDAVAELIAADGLDGVVALAHAAKYPGFLGAAVADADAQNVGRQLLEFIDDDDDSALVAVAYSWAARRGFNDFAWVSDLIEEFADRPRAQARILLVSGDLPHAWSAAAQCADVDSAYWSEFSPFGRGHDFEFVNEASRNLLAHDRPRAALALMNIYATSNSVEPGLVVEGLEALLRQPPDHPDQFRIDSYEIQQLLEVARLADVPEERLAQLEWALRPALDFDAHSPILEAKLASDPAFFVEVLSMAFRPRNSDNVGDVAEHVARNAYQLLDDWSVLPGSSGDGSAIDQQVLSTWIDEALRLAGEADRVEIALDQIGKVLAKAPSDLDGSWPTAAVRHTLERIGRSELDVGFSVQILNSRGVHSRGITDGGERERELEARYARLATMVSDGSPRTAALLRKVAASYAAEAHRMDEEAARRSEGPDL